MKAITLHQPWASLVAIGAKWLETRSRPFNFRGDIAIHASSSRAGEAEAKRLPIKNAIRAAGYRDFDQLPLGSIVAVAFLEQCTPAEEAAEASQLPFGDFTPGRWAWMFGSVDRFIVPIPASGKQGIWNITLPKRACHECGCVEERACPGGCSWIYWDLCSACV